MAKGARVLDPMVFSELKAALSAYQSATEEDLGAISREIEQAKVWIEQRVGYWRGQVNRLAHELAQAQAALARCQSEARSSSEQHHSASDCSELQRAAECAKRALEQAQANLEIAKTWQMQIIGTSEEFRVKAQGFRQNVSSQVASTGQLLSKATDRLQGYSSSQNSGLSSKKDSGSRDKASPGQSNARVNDNLNKKFSTKEQMQAHVSNAIEKINENENYRVFLDQLRQQGESLESLLKTDLENGRNYSRYLSNIAYIAKAAGLDATTTGNFVHRVGELHTLIAHPDKVIEGTRLIEQRIGSKELDRVVVKDDVHYIRDIKPIHLNEFEKTESGKSWADYMTCRYGNDFREKIATGKLLPITQQMDPQIKHDLRLFMKDDVRRYKTQFENYRQLYIQTRGIQDASKVKISIQPYYVF